MMGTAVRFGPASQTLELKAVNGVRNRQPVQVLLAQVLRTGRRQKLRYIRMQISF